MKTIAIISGLLGVITFILFYNLAIAGKFISAVITCSLTVLFVVLFLVLIKKD